MLKAALTLGKYNMSSLKIVAKFKLIYTKNHWHTKMMSLIFCLVMICFIYTGIFVSYDRQYIRESCKNYCLESKKQLV